MSSLPLLTLRILGPTVAKGLIDAFGLESKLTNDLLKKTVDVGAAKWLKAEGKSVTLEKKVGEIAAQMAADIRPLFAGAGRRIAANSQDAIVLGLAQTLTKAGLTQAGLAELNFDPGALEKLLVKANPDADRDFLVGESSLYRQALGIVSRRLIESAPSVEGFELNAAAETLRRLEEIAVQLGQARDRAVQAADEFVGRYRNVVNDELDRLEVFGLPRMDRLTSRQSLSMAYITLSATGESDEESSELLAAKRFGEKAVLQKSIGQDASALGDETLLLIGERGPRRILQQVDGAMCDRQRIVIRGGAGAGKSTLMQWLAVRSASQSFEGKLETWNTKIPFFIRLRSLVNEPFPTPDKFPALVAPNFVAMMPDKWVHKYLERGQALVLIDGVDELPRQRRENFLKSLKALVRDFPAATYLVTSRPSGLKDIEEGGAWQAWEDWVNEKGFATLTLEPMNSEKVRAFVGKWHEALPADMVPSHLTRSPMQMAESLNRQLQQRPELQRLASTPLLCAMICALHRERLETLPSARLELYRECIDMLLNRRDTGRRIPLDETYPVGLNESQKVELLQSLALKLMRADLSSLETARVDRHFDSELRKTSLPASITGEQIRALFVDRAALLREPIVGQIDFAHRTFQEYLAAKAVLDEDCLEELLQRAENDQWREAIIAAAGLARPTERTKLLRWLINRGNGSVMGAARFAFSSLFNKDADDDIRVNKSYLYLLAVACLETATSVEPQTRNYVRDCAKALMPLRDDDEVDMVVRAGNEVVPILQYDARYTAKDAGRCVEALVGIGTRSAMSLIVAYAKADFKGESYLALRGLGEAIGKGWEIFDKEAYLNDVLLHVTHLDLNQTQVSDVTPLSGLSQLRGLDLNLNAGERYYSPQRALTATGLIFESNAGERCCAVKVIKKSDYCHR